MHMPKLDPWMETNEYAFCTSKLKTQFFEKIKTSIPRNKIIKWTLKKRTENIGFFDALKF